MSPEVAELLKQIEASILEAAQGAGTPSDGSVVIRLRPDVHEAVCERMAPVSGDGPEGYAVTCAGFYVTQGPPDMVDAWQFKRAEDLPRRKARKINPGGGS